MAQGSVSDEEMADLVRHAAEATSAYIRGDMNTYLTHISHAEDYTLLPPTGGEPVHGFDGSDEANEARARMFRGGDAELEVFAKYSSGDMVVLVVIERQHGEVAGLPDQDWSLRVTLVFRRDESGWWLVHRHADPLVHEIGMDQLATLASG
jgi:ketosteroid isomerase-like protein